MKRVGKNWMKRERAQAQAKAHNDFIKSLPLDIRKAMKQRDQACAGLCELVNTGADRETYAAQRQTYDALCNQVKTMLEEYRHAQRAN